MPDVDETRRVGGRRSAKRGTLRSVRTLALALLVVSASVVAGCGALSGSDGGTGDGTAPDGTSVAEADTATASAESRFEAKLSGSPETVFQRVDELLGADGAPYPEVEFGGATTFNRSEPFYLQVVGPPENRSTLASTPAVTYDYSADTVTVTRERLDAVDGARLEAELVYYATVSLGLKNGWFRLPERPNGYTVITAAIGSVVDRYAERYRQGVADPPQSYDETSLSDYEWARSGGADYYASRWVESRIDAPVEIPALVTDGMPASGEQLLHDTEDEPLALGLTLETSERWYRGGEANWYTRGEHGTRAVLETKSTGRGPPRPPRGGARTASSSSRHWETTRPASSGLTAGTPRERPTSSSPRWRPTSTGATGRPTTCASSFADRLPT